MRALQLSRAGVLASSVVSASTLPEAEWLMTCVAPDGAITETPGDINVRPYMACYGALGLIRAFEVTGHQPYADAAKAWCVWYAAHMDPTTGYVNDYTADGDGNRVDSGAADSTDAYAGMFAVVALKTWLATHADDAGWIDTVNAAAPGGNALLLALTAITSTQQEDGLTWALPTYTVKYLEDNLEALAGFSALDTLALFTDNAAVSAAIATPEITMASGLGNLWNYVTRTYDYALHEDNTFTPNDWGDENSRRQQVWALAWGADPPGFGDSDALMDAYLAALPDWSTQTSSYEVLPAWALNRLGRPAEAAAAVTDLEASVAAADHAYPWTCATSGQLIMAKHGTGQLSYAGPTFPAGVNLMPNPDFALDSNADGIADGVLNYGNPAMTLIPDSPSPSHIQQMVNPGGLDMHWDPIDVTGGRFYVLSCYRKITALDPGNLGVLTYKLYKADGTYLTYGYAPTVTNALDADFVRWWITIWADDTVGKIQPVIGAGNPGAITIQVKAIQLEEAGCTPTPFVYPPHAAPLLFSDDFSRADGPVTAPWLTTAGHDPINIVSGTARGVGWSSVDVGVHEVDVTLDYAALNGEGSGFFVGLGWDGATAGVAIYVEPTDNTVRAFRISDSAPIQPAVGLPENGYVGGVPTHFRYRWAGTQLTAWCGAAQVFSADTSSITSIGNRVFLPLFSANQQVDNLVISASSS